MVLVPVNRAVIARDGLATLEAIGHKRHGGIAGSSVVNLGGNDDKSKDCCEREDCNEFLVRAQIVAR